jgi:hypothetical protein
MLTATRIVWETHWELEARLRRCTLAPQRDALRMLLAFRRHGDLSDFEVGELIGRAPHEIWQWWRVYQNDGLDELLEIADQTPWLAISGVAVPPPIDPSTLPFGVPINAPRERPRQGLR